MLVMRNWLMCFFRSFSCREVLPYNQILLVPLVIDDVLLLKASIFLTVHAVLFDGNSLPAHLYQKG